jgi:hypothetical protein
MASGGEAIRQRSCGLQRKAEGERGPCDRRERAPGPETADDLGLEQADHGRGEGVVETVADAADRRRDAGVGEAPGVGDRHIWHTAIAVMNEAALDGTTGVQGLLQGVEHDGGPGAAG